MHLYSITHWCLGGSATILVDLVVSSSLIALEVLDLFLRHQTGDHIRLDLLELEPETLVRVVFLIGLILDVRQIIGNGGNNEAYLVIED
jgi:hypothetical protein